LFYILKRITPDLRLSVLVNAESIVYNTPRKLSLKRSAGGRPSSLKINPIKPFSRPRQAVIGQNKEI
jgi:hypothetical protein